MKIVKIERGKIAMAVTEYNGQKCITVWTDKSSPRGWLKAETGITIPEKDVELVLTFDEKQGVEAVIEILQRLAQDWKQNNE